MHTRPAGSSDVGGAAAGSPVHSLTRSPTRRRCSRRERRRLPNSAPQPRPSSSRPTCRRVASTTRMSRWCCRWEQAVLADASALDLFIPACLPCVPVSVIFKLMPRPRPAPQVGVPSSREQYIHRLGRTARAGRTGRGLLMLMPEEQHFLRQLRGESRPLCRRTAVMVPSASWRLVSCKSMLCQLGQACLAVRIDRGGEEHAASRSAPAGKPSRLRSFFGLPSSGCPQAHLTSRWPAPAAPPPQTCLCLRSSACPQRPRTWHP